MVYRESSRGEDTPLGGANADWAGAGYGDSQPHVLDRMVEDQVPKESRITMLKNVMQPCDHTILNCPICLENELQGV